MKPVDYELLCGQLKALTEDVPYEVANLANASALLWQTLPEINWAGFYKMENGILDKILNEGTYIRPWVDEKLKALGCEID